MLTEKSGKSGCVWINHIGRRQGTICLRDGLISGKVIIYQKEMNVYSNSLKVKENSVWQKSPRTKGREIADECVEIAIKTRGRPCKRNRGMSAQQEYGVK